MLYQWSAIPLIPSRIKIQPVVDLLILRIPEPMGKAGLVEQIVGRSNVIALHVRVGTPRKVGHFRNPLAGKLIHRANHLGGNSAHDLAFRHILIHQRAGGNDGIGSDGDPWHDDGLMADEDVVKDVDLPHGVDSDIERLLNHVDTAVMAKDGATGQMDIAAQSGICRIGEFHIRLDAASLAHGVQTTMNLDVFCPCIAVGLANPLIQTYQLAGFKGVCTKRFFNCCVNWTRHLKFIYRVDD